MSFDIEKKHFKVIRIVWYNAESKWGVLATEPLFKLSPNQEELMNSYGNISITGNFEGIYVDGEIEVTGDIVDGRYGKAIQLRSYTIIHDSRTKEGVVNFLARSLIKGINVQNAKKIYEAFKDKAIDIVLDNPEKLIGIKGIGAKTVHKVQDSVSQYKKMKPLIDYCSTLGLPYNLIKKLYDELGDKALESIKTDPYHVLEISSTITFKQMDEVFLKSGGSPSAMVRLETGLLYVLKNLAVLEGSTGCKSSTLKNKFYSTLNLEGGNSEYESTADKLAQEGKLELGENALTGIQQGYVYYKKFVDIEKNIAEKVQTLNKYGLLGDKIREDVVEEEIKDFPFTLNEKQVEAVHKCLEHNVSVLTGCAGCLTGDTKVNIRIGKQRYDRKYSMKRLYELYLECPDMKYYTRSFNFRTKKIELNEIEKVVYSGRKVVYELLVETGKTLKATADHEILTSNGFKQLKDLNKGDLVATRYNDSPSIIWEVFLCCKECGEEDTYDICCYENHNFVANGIVVHNSGKSSITKALSHIYRRCGFSVYHLSPTAKACRRLEECIGTQDAQTIHKFLGMRKDEEYKQIKTYPQDAVLIVDEASMIDIILFNYLLLGSSLTTRILLIGDNHQLPSVQAGNVLGDLIDSKQVHVSELTDVMRQKENSNIIKYCTMINDGEIFDPVEATDFHYEEFGEGSELKDFFFKKYVQEVKENGLNEVQVITPYKKGELGMDTLNTYIQEKYNAEGEITIEPFRMGDKVRHTVNNYDKDVYNGETGTIIQYDEEDEEMLVDYGNKVITYDKSDVVELVLAYVSTVHASQGSEYKVVFVILDDTSVNDFLLIRRLLYTAVSRGKKKVYILTKPYLVDKCITNDSYRPRITKLKEFMQSEE